jgi:hypothetical protein
VIEFKIVGKSAIVTIDGIEKTAKVHINQFGSLDFLQGPCAIVKTSPDALPLMGRLCICQNYQAVPTIGAIIFNELYRDVIGVKWPEKIDWEELAAIRQRIESKL